MTKIFDPKITPGEWGIDSFGHLFSHSTFDCIATFETNITGEQRNQNSKAIAAIPQLLEVVKAARNVIDVAVNKNTDPKFTRADMFLIQLELKEALRNLDEMHGDEQ